MLAMQEDGYFDVNGNFVWKKENEEPDAWLAGLGESEMEESIGAAARAKEKRDKAEEEAEEDPLDAMSINELRTLLVDILEPRETPIT